MKPRKSSIIEKKAIIFFVFFAVQINIEAQSLKSLSLYDALKIAKENNNQVKKVQLKFEKSEEIIKETKEGRLPDFEFHSSYSRVTNITEFENLSLQKHAVTKTIPEMYDVSTSFKVSIYEGNKINNLIRKAKQENAIDKLYIKKIEDDVQMKVVATFLKIYELEELQKIIDENITEEKKRLEEIESLKKHGVVTKNEVLRAELQLADRELSALTNKKDLKIAKNDLKILLQLNNEDQFVISTLEITKESEKIQDYTYFLNKALSNEDFQINNEELAIKKTDLQLVKSNFYPKINLYGNYGFKYPNYMFFPPSDYLYSMGQIGIELKYNLFNLYKNKSKMRISKNEIETKQVDLLVLQDDIKSKIFNDYAQYEEALDRILFANKSLTLAEENYRIVKTKYLNQMVLITEMIDADNSLLYARYNKIAVKINEVYKHYQLLYTAGIIADKF